MPKGSLAPNVRVAPLFPRSNTAAFYPRRLFASPLSPYSIRVVSRIYELAACLTRDERPRLVARRYPLAGRFPNPVLNKSSFQRKLLLFPWIIVARKISEKTLPNIRRSFIHHNFTSFTSIYLA